jgi:hypothetical protein
MARTRADVREAELLEDLADRALVVSDAEALGHDLLQVHPAPAGRSYNSANCVRRVVSREIDAMTGDSPVPARRRSRSAVTFDISPSASIPSERWNSAMLERVIPP